MKNPLALLSAIGFSIGLVSCELPRKALVIAEGPKSVPKQEKKTEVDTQTPITAQNDDGLRMPDMLTLPEETQLRSAAPEGSRDSPVIVRPPTVKN